MASGVRIPAELSYLGSPPDALGSVPPDTRPQTLPLDSLEPRDFERLCFRLARLDASVEQCRVYGLPGQKQEGIDLYVRRSDGAYWVIQSKRRSAGGFGPAQVTAAIDRFLEGGWAGHAEALVLAVSANLDATQTAVRIEEERARLEARAVKLVIWDETELSAILKDHPRLVDDFFGREALQVFVGPDAARRLGDRLDAADVLEYRESLGRLYTEVFARVERGIHGEDRNVPLEARFVLPDVVSVAERTPPRPGQSPQPSELPATPRSRPNRHRPDVRSALQDPELGARITGSGVHAADRIDVTAWLQTGDWHVVVGAPGSGKSALLRTVVLEVLSPSPAHIGDVGRLHGLLPVWLPFSFWTTLERKTGGRVSVLDAVGHWLTAYDHGHLADLVARALRDERLLLVVDGFDEWASPDIARVCVDRLEVFARTQSAQVLASSRHFSTAEVPIDTSSWRIAELAPLDDRQQMQFIRQWLRPLVEPGAVDLEAAEWARDIHSSGHLRELSDLPLFLLLLLRSREQQSEFPEDLYSVLSEAIARLIGDHRRKKVDASGASDLFPPSTVIRKVMAVAAEHMHRESAVAITDDELCALFRGTLSEVIGHPEEVAHTMATALVNSLSQGVGVMVRPAPDETQFFHRSVLEFLAAERLLTLPLDELARLFCEQLGSRRWSQVLRFVVRGLVRPPEIDSIFDSLNGAAAVDPLLAEATTMLAAEVAVGGANVEGATRHRLLRHAADVVETGERVRHRAAVADALTLGLSRPEVSEALEGMVATWMEALPSVAWASAIDATSNWDPDDVLFDILWHGILAEDNRVQRVAARGLSEKFRDRVDLADRIANLARTTNLFDRQAAAIEALSLGWPSDPRLDELITEGRDAMSFSVRHAAIAADLRRGNCGPANRSALISLFDGKPSLSAWCEGLLELMLTHFPGDEVIYAHYLELARIPEPRHARTTDEATFVVLKGYAERTEARDLLMRLVGPDRDDSFRRSPALVTDRVPWRDVARTFSTDPGVVAAVEQLIHEQLESSIGERDAYFGALLARTDRVRDEFLARLRKRDKLGIGWTIQALRDGWPDDSAVTQALTDLVNPKLGRVASAAVAHLPQIIPDPWSALQALSELATDEEDHGAILSALQQLIADGIPKEDPRVKEMVDRALEQDMTDWSTTPEGALYLWFADYPRVRDLAKRRLHDRGVPLSALVRGFPQDPEMRRLVSRRLRPVGAPLRGRLVEALAKAPRENRAATALLGRYDAEPEPTVKILAATAYARRLLAEGDVSDSAVDCLVEQAHAVGFDYMERRAAAFCALAELGQLGRLSAETEPITGEPVQIQHSGLDDSSVFFRHICRHWDDVKEAFGPNFVGRFGYRSAESSEFWREVLLVAHDYPATREDVGRKLSADPELVRSIAGVSYLSRIEPRSDRLLSAVLDLLDERGKRAYFDLGGPWPALDILADQYRGNHRLEAWLDGHLDDIAAARRVDSPRTAFALPPFGVLAALARHRADHPLVTELAAYTARVEDESWYYFHHWIELVAATCVGSREFLESAVEAARIIELNDFIPDHLHHAFRARLQRDERLAEAVSDAVATLRGPALGIALRCLASGGRFNTELAEHLMSVLRDQGRGRAETYDCLTGGVYDVEWLLLELLDSLGGR